MGRKKAREGAMSLVYKMEMNDEFSKDMEDLYMNNFDYSREEEDYIYDASEKIRENIETIDQYIVDNLKGWKLDRLAKVDLSVLRIAIYEILYREDIPMEVSVNEAIETVKKYSAEESYKFVNGVLGGVINSLEKS